MAFTFSSVQQPDLRSFIIYDRLPAGCISYPVTDNSNAPHLRTGDFVIVDPSDRQASDGELFVVQWQGGPQVPQIVETFRLGKLTGWAVAAVRPLPNVSITGEVPGPPMRWCDFGYTDEHLSRRLIGRVIGILETSFAEPRLALT